jgi:hypothetical protein
MQLPSKVTTYQESIISLFPTVLGMLSERKLSVGGLFSEIKKKNKNLSVDSFIDILDCLFFLKKIKLSQSGEEIEKC